ncbi:sodium:proton antiporter [Thermomonas sp.]|uniref:cation:proton antiporter n=1 Tax=Thermomonas sp. TaxID=1971895 RepID=UPI0024884FD8|nr:sodium:proton antiporter [Thermomonas sp.]MDI1253666.1 sodium:proton antiporter [Thermomonas sp.]
MTRIDAAFVILGLVVATTLLARRFRAPSPVIFAISGLAAGIAWHWIPGMPLVRMPPDLVLFAFLPPLLTVAAYAMPLQSFRRNRLPIGLLAIGLVLATIVVTAVFGHVVAGLPWAAALVLGAIVAPPDPVAATTVAAKTGLSHRLVVILEGEGLVNDAIAIVAYGIALKAATTGYFSWSDAAMALAKAGPLGIAVGLTAGWAAKLLRQYADSVPLEVAISLVTPYLAYHVAERTGGSGVLAVVTLGFMLRHFATSISGASARLAARTVWGAIRFASTSLVFLLLGLLMGQSIVTRPPWELLAASAAVAGGVIALRMVWMYVIPPIVESLRGDDSPRTTWGERTVLGWAGMRGIVSLALALALPFSIGGDNGTRDSIIVITFAVIFATLMLQGLTLVPLVRWLRVGDASRDERDEHRARCNARRAGIVAIAHARKEGHLDEAQCQRLLQRLRDGDIGIAKAGLGKREPNEDRALMAALSAQRRQLDLLRQRGRLSENLSERLATELDIDMMGALGEADRLTGVGED